MKNTTKVFASIFAIFIFAACGVHGAGAPINVDIDGKMVQFLDARPFVDTNGRTMIPVRAVSESLGAKVQWIQEKRLVVIDREKTNILLPVGKKDIVVNTAGKLMDTTTQIYQNRTYVPLRFVSEAFGFTVQWNNDTRSVLISTNGSEPVAATQKEQVKLTATEKVEVSTRIVTLPAFVAGTTIEEIRFSKGYIHVVQSQPVELTLYMGPGITKGSTLFIQQDGSESKFATEKGQYIAEYNLEILKSQGLSIQDIPKLGFKKYGDTNLIWVANPKGGK